MGSLTNYGENALLGHFVATAYTPVATVYLALCTADPTEAATGASMSECANANNYARVAITFGAAASRRVTQSGAVNFAQISGGSQTATHWVVTDSATHGAGNALAYGAFGTAKNLVSGSTPSVATTEVYVEVSTGGIFTTPANSFLDLMFRNQAYSQPATYVGVTTTTNSDGAAGTEVSGGSYARVLVNKASGASPAWTAVTSGAADNANAISFANPSGSWGTCVALAAYSASSAGTPLLYFNDMTDQAITSGDTVSIATGALDISVT